jgi:hypothetical protein
VRAAEYGNGIKKARERLNESNDTLKARVETFTIAIHCSPLAPELNVAVINTVYEIIQAADEICGSLFLFRFNLNSLLDIINKGTYRVTQWLRDGESD